jgi:small-conductance mechanosensitive channel
MKKISAIIDLVLRAIGLAMGVAVVVLGILGVAEVSTMITLIGIGLFCLGLSALDQVKDEELDKI